MTETAAVWGEIDGREITFPMEVTDFNAATILYSVPADAAAALLPGDAFEIVEIAPGTAQFIIAACDYVANPWGDYNELNLGFLARPAGAPADVIGSFVYRMPVDQAFTCAAGNQVMGFPKTVEDLTSEYTDDSVTFAWRIAGGSAQAAAPILAITVPRAPATGEPARIDAVSYSYLGGRPYGTTLSMDMGTGLVDPGDVTIELGEGPVADELRGLGLPKTPDLGAWGEGLSATFFLGQPVG